MNGQEIKKGERNARLTEVSQSVIKRIYCQTFNKHRYRIIIYRFSFCGNWDRETIIRKAEDKKKIIHSQTCIQTHRLTRKRQSTRKRRKSNPSPVNNLHVVEKCVTNDHHICLCASNAFHKWLIFIEKKKQRWQQAAAFVTAPNMSLLHFCTISYWFFFSLLICHTTTELKQIRQTADKTQRKK